MYQQDGPGGDGEGEGGEGGESECPGCLQRIISSHDDGLTWSKPALATLVPKQQPNATYGKALASGIALTRGQHAGRLLQVETL